MTERYAGIDWAWTSRGRRSASTRASVDAGNSRWSSLAAAWSARRATRASSSRAGTDRDALGPEARGRDARTHRRTSGAPKPRRQDAHDAQRRTRSGRRSRPRHAGDNAAPTSSPPASIDSQLPLRRTRAAVHRSRTRRHASDRVRPEVGPGPQPAASVLSDSELRERKAHLLRVRKPGDRRSARRAVEASFVRSRKQRVATTSVARRRTAPRAAGAPTPARYRCPDQLLADVLIRRQPRTRRVPPSETCWRTE